MAEKSKSMFIRVTREAHAALKTIKDKATEKFGRRVTFDELFRMLISDAKDAQERYDALEALHRADLQKESNIRGLLNSTILAIIATTATDQARRDGRLHDAAEVSFGPEFKTIYLRCTCKGCEGPRSHGVHVKLEDVLNQPNVKTLAQRIVDGRLKPMLEDPDPEAQPASDFATANRLSGFFGNGQAEALN